MWKRDYRVRIGRRKPLSLVGRAGVCVAVLGALTLAGCGGRKVDLEVRLADGPTVAPPIHRLPSGSAVRLAYANVLSPRRSKHAMKKFARYLTRQLKTKVTLIPRRSYAATNELLRLGKADVGLICSGAYAHDRDPLGLQLVASVRVDGRATYRAHVIARRDEAASGLEQLRGKVFAFSDPLSNTGYRYVADQLVRRGTSPGAFFARFIFTHSHDNTVSAVRDGLVDAGVVDSLVWDQMLASEPALSQYVRVIETSEPFPINPVVAVSTASPALIADLRRALLTMNEDPLGRKVLALMGLSSCGPAKASEYDQIAASWERLRKLHSSRPVPPDEDRP